MYEEQTEKEKEGKEEEDLQRAERGRGGARGGILRELGVNAFIQGRAEKKKGYLRKTYRVTQMLVSPPPLLSGLCLTPAVRYKGIKGICWLVPFSSASLLSHA